MTFFEHLSQLQLTIYGHRTFDGQKQVTISIFLQKSQDYKVHSMSLSRVEQLWSLRKLRERWKYFANHDDMTKIISATSICGTDSYHVNGMNAQRNSPQKSFSNISSVNLYVKTEWNSLQVLQKHFFQEHTHMLPQ